MNSASAAPGVTSTSSGESGLAAGGTGGRSVGCRLALDCSAIRARTAGWPQWSL